MTCHYCGEPSSRCLDNEPVCVDCAEHLKFTPKDEREGFILDRLQKLHAMLLAAPSPTPYIRGWITRTAARLEFCQRARGEVSPPVQVPVVSKVPTAKRVGPLRVRKFR